MQEIYLALVLMLRLRSTCLQGVFGAVFQAPPAECLDWNVPFPTLNMPKARAQLLYSTHSWSYGHGQIIPEFGTFNRRQCESGIIRRINCEWSIVAWSWGSTRHGLLIRVSYQNKTMSFGSVWTCTKCHRKYVGASRSWAADAKAPAISFPGVPTCETTNSISISTSSRNM